MSRTPAGRIALALLLTLAVGMPFVAGAHEGDEPPAASAPAFPVEGHRTRVAESDAHELLLEADAIEPGHPALLHLLLSDYETNAPVGGAQLEVIDAARDSAWDGHEERPGVYAVTAAFAEPGWVRLDVVVRRGEDVDLLTLDSVRVGPSPEGGAAATGAGRGLPAWAFGAFAGFGLLAIAGLFAIGRSLRAARRTSRALGLLAALWVATGTSSDVRAHEPTLHGAGQAPERDAHADHPSRTGGSVVPPGARFMAKEAQFELGLLTAVARLDTIPETRRAFGTVVADPATTAHVIAPQTGRFVSRRAWRIGDRVGRGQTIGALLVIDELPMRAPVGGTITALSVVSGQNVVAGQEIATIVDLDRVRVEVPLYGEALATATHAKGAVVRLPALPGQPLVARVVGLSPSAAGGPSVPLVLTVARAGALLRPGMVVEAELRLPAARPAIVVPSSAVLATERGPVVFVKVAPEAFELRPVTLGGTAGDKVAIANGVTAGERIVVQGGVPLLATAEVGR